MTISAAKQAYLDFVFSANPNDPKEWLSWASVYRSATMQLIEDFQKIKDGDSLDNFAINAINATPYLAAVASELYLKGYLISKGEEYNVVRRYLHNLPSLRKDCEAFGDERFNNVSVKFLTDTLYHHIYSSGGARYPDRLAAPVYFDEFTDALNILNTILIEELRSKSNDNN